MTHFSILEHNIYGAACIHDEVVPSFILPLAALIITALHHCYCLAAPKEKVEGLSLIIGFLCLRLVCVLF